MSKSFLGETSKTAVSQCAVTNKRRDVLTKQLKAGQQTVVATEPRMRDGGNLDVITDSSFSSVLEVTRASREYWPNLYSLGGIGLLEFCREVGQKTLSKFESRPPRSQQICLARQLDRERCRSDSQGSPSNSRVQARRSLPRRGNSTPRQAVQQSTKRDRRATPGPLADVLVRGVTAVWLAAQLA